MNSITPPESGWEFCGENQNKNATAEVELVPIGKKSEVANSNPNKGEIVFLSSLSHASTWRSKTFLGQYNRIPGNVIHYLIVYQHAIKSSTYLYKSENGTWFAGNSLNSHDNSSYLRNCSQNSCNDILPPSAGWEYLMNGKWYGDDETLKLTFIELSEHLKSGSSNVQNQTSSENTESNHRSIYFPNMADQFLEQDILYDLFGCFSPIPFANKNNNNTTGFRNPCQT